MVLNRGDHVAPNHLPILSKYFEEMAELGYLLVLKMINLVLDSDHGKDPDQ